MANIVLYDPLTNQVTARYTSVNDPDVPNVLVNPDLSLVSGFPMRQWKVVGDTVVLMSQVERYAVEANFLEVAA